MEFLFGASVLLVGVLVGATIVRSTQIKPPTNDDKD